jgi:spermidine synthase
MKKSKKAVRRPSPPKRKPAKKAKTAARKAAPKVIKEYLNPHFGYFYTWDKVLAQAKTKFQELKVVKTPEFGKVLLLDGITQVGEKHEFLYHEPMVHPALLAHPDPESVCIIGGGDGGIAREVLKHPSVRRVDQVDLDGDVYAFSEKHLPSVSGGAFRDPRLKKITAEGRGWIEKSRGQYDVVIMDMTDPFGPAKMLYTREYFEAVKASFKDPLKGLFTMHAESPISRPRTFNSILQTLGLVFHHVSPFYLYIQMYAVQWCVAVSSDHWDLGEIAPDVVDEKIRLRRLYNLQVVNGATFRAMQAEFPYVSAIRARKAKLLTDHSPDVEDVIGN